MLKLRASFQDSSIVIISIYAINKNLMNEHSICLLNTIYGTRMGGTHYTVKIANSKGSWQIRYLIFRVK